MPKKGISGSVQRHELIRPQGRDRPDIGPAAWRLVKAGVRYSELFDYIDVAVSHRTNDFPTIRAPLDDPADLEFAFDDVWGIPEEDTRHLTMLASECLHHVRTALDYCAYFVVWADSKVRRDNTKFPLVLDRTRWNRGLRDSLPGITQTHIGWVEAVQPFQGVKWTAHLVEMSNRDKHRVAVDVVPSYGFEFDVSRRYLDPEGDPNFIGYQVDRHEIQFRLSDGLGGDPASAHLEVTATLMGILTGATDLLNQFLAEAGHEPVSITKR